MADDTNKGVNFGFNKPAAPVTQTKAGAPVANPAPEQKPAEDKELDAPYFDERSVVIMLVKDYSLYRKVNDKVMQKRVDYIGSSVKSSRVLSANKEEVEFYFPNLIGLAPNNVDFITRVKQYLNNIRIAVDELGRKFNTSFQYKTKRDYLAFVAKEQEIENAFKAVNRQDIMKFRAALNEKLDRLNALYSTQFKYGYPQNTEDYLMWRHCLLYSDVAKDMSLINVEKNVRFYIKDEQKETERLIKFREQVNRAKANYVSCLADNVLFDAVYVQYCVLNNLPVLSSLAKNRLDREIEIDKFSSNDPRKFNTIFNDKDVKLIADIEMLVARGELIKSNYNQNITTVDGDFIGANMNEAVAWFKNPENLSAANAYRAKLRNI